MISYPKFKFENNQKGINGSVLVIGGSSLYTGAPYATALSSFLTGADLVYIYTKDEAILSLKVLLPEAIVSGFEYQTWILNRIDICVFGPGLDYIEDKTERQLKNIIRHLIDRNVYIIVDGDGIKYAEMFDILNYQHAIFTPNINESKIIRRFTKLRYVINKDVQDKIVLKNKIQETITCPGCSKRCGGQGDILCGILASLIIKVFNRYKPESVVGCMSLACKILRKAGNKAYIKKGASTIMRDIIEELPDAFKEVMCDDLSN